MIKIEDFIDKLINFNNHELREHCFKLQKSGKGICLEFGTYFGESLSMYSKWGFREKTIYGFDSFEGLPEDWIIGEKKYVKGDMSVTKTLLLDSNIILVKGWFNETLPIWKKYLNITRDNEITFIHIDCDLYSSTKTIFKELNDLIKKDCIIVFDDLYAFFNEKSYSDWYIGEFKALNEWLKEYNREVEVIGAGSNSYAGAIRITK